MDESAFQALERIYADLDAALARLSPICRGRGDCCRLRESGHRLFVTPLEMEYLRAGAGFASADRALTGRGICPFLRDGKCGVRDRRMLGCRIYYCDTSFRPRMTGLYEEFHARLKRAMREHGVPYEYVDFLESMAKALFVPRVI